jgi:hypothetical protein
VIGFSPLGEQPLGADSGGPSQALETLVFSFSRWDAQPARFYPTAGFTSSFYKPSLPSPVPTRGYADWQRAPWRAAKGASFEPYVSDQYPPPTLTSFTWWPPAHKIVYPAQHFDPFRVAFPAYLYVEPHDGPKRPKHKIKRRSRFDYSIYNHPFDVLHEEAEEPQELSVDDLLDLRIEVLDEMLAELGADPNPPPPAAANPTEPPAPLPDLLALERLEKERYNKFFSFIWHKYLRS